ncbi:hypothetical protein BC936DRAFT_149110 [Jimgerdemannia flammicorona]|uniref:BRCA2 OB1 domain-containing protein n=1 Tax=Jimgerdemannia flammicorona TaxID=994334 RepID=A0A433D1K5_9FUNG|nr:hypothetical protein BC936DRAFT_149110 [Jimgerdemannia flammicorona]
MISANGTRLASWDTTLGYQKRPVTFRPLSTLSTDGGLIPLVDVIIMRKYPLAFNEILRDGSIITRTAREEDLAGREHEVNILIHRFSRRILALKEKQLDAMATEVERKWLNTGLCVPQNTGQQTTSQGHFRRMLSLMLLYYSVLIKYKYIYAIHSADLRHSDTAEELYNLFLEGPDQTSFYEMLTPQQREILDVHCERLQLEKRAKIDQEIYQRISVRPLTVVWLMGIEIFDMQMDRKISAFFKIKVCDYPNSGGTNKREATIIIGNTNTDQFEDLHEGKRYHFIPCYVQIYSLTAHIKQGRVTYADSSCMKPLRLKTTPKTKWREIGANEAILATSMYSPRVVTPCGRLSEMSNGDEVDLVVVVLQNVTLSFILMFLSVNGIHEWPPNTSHGGGGPMLSQLGDVIAFRNLYYSLYDWKYGIHLLKATDEVEVFRSDTSTLSRRAPHKLTIDELERWIKSNCDKFQKLKERATSLTSQLVSVV